MRHIVSVFKRTRFIILGKTKERIDIQCICKSNFVNSESMMRMAVSVGRDQLGSVGVCFGKFTKTGKFKLHITALDHLAQYAKVIGMILNAIERIEY